MDDMVFQYNNQNSIYVLNANYTSYEEHYGIIDSIDHQTTVTTNNNNNKNNWKHQKKLEESSKSLQQQLKIFNKDHSNGNEIGNPIGSLLSSTATCSPAATVIQKLINCTSKIENTTSISLNDRIKDCAEAFDVVSMNCNRNGNIHGTPRSSSSSNSNSNGSSKLSSVMIGNSTNSKNKKKCNNITPTLIAKKTKCWKFLEEEKIRLQEEHDANNGGGNGATTIINCEQCMSMSYNSSAGLETRSQTKESLNGVSASSSASTKTNEPHHRQQQQQQQCIQPQQKVSNCSANHYTNTLQLKQQQQQQKSSYELYKEAAELLGLSCTLCDNCRCLDCQSGYFDCDDSDSYSDFSTMDDFEYGFEEPYPATAREMALIMHSSAEDKCLTNELHQASNPSKPSVASVATMNSVEITSAKCDVESDDDITTHDTRNYFCSNGNCRTEMRSNGIVDDMDDSSFQFHNMNFNGPAAISTQQVSAEMPSTESLTSFQRTSSCALINTMNLAAVEDQPDLRHGKEQEQEHEHEGRSLEDNNAENCASFNGLNLLDTTKVSDDASDCENQIDFKN